MGNGQSPIDSPYIYILVGGFNHLEKYESQWEGLSHILWTNKKCSKPPISQFFGERERRCWEMKNFTSPPESLAFHKSCKDWEPGTDGSSPAWGPVPCSWTTNEKHTITGNRLPHHSNEPWSYYSVCNMIIYIVLYSIIYIVLYLNIIHTKSWVNMK